MRVLAVSLVFAAVLAQSTSPYIENLTWPEVQRVIARKNAIAIIYTGGTEQNGPHMAIGKHNFIAHYVAGAIAIKLGNALVYPVIPFAPAGDPIRRTGHMRFPGTVSITAQTYNAIVHDAALSAAVAGFRDVVLMGDHGTGQDVLASVAKSLDAQWKPKGVRVFYIPDLYYKARQQSRAYEAAHGIKQDEHAGTDDTSQLMAIDSLHQWIRADKIAVGGPAQYPVTGVNGDPTKASAALGRIFLGYKIDDAVAQIRSLVGPR
jgi:creatinine amidohydrolase/Fe(II)-dependent formamide hydrolase-like protein